MLKSIKRLTRAVLIGVLSLTLSVLILTPSAVASLHTYPESETQTMYRSRLSVQDNQSQAWQLILFKRLRAGQVQDFNLRLVGFPGQVAVQHPADLVLEDSYDHRWVAPDQTQADPQLAPVLNSVGQYDLQSMMATLDQAERLELHVRLADDSERILVVPKFMVSEWLKLKDTIA